jgi:hypothetical protein
MGYGEELSIPHVLNIGQAFLLTTKLIIRAIAHFYFEKIHQPVSAFWKT